MTVQGNHMVMQYIMLHDIIGVYARWNIQMIKKLCEINWCKTLTQVIFFKRLKSTDIFTFIALFLLWSAFGHAIYSKLKFISSCIIFLAWEKTAFLILLNIQYIIFLNNYWYFKTVVYKNIVFCLILTCNSNLCQK